MMNMSAAEEFFDNTVKVLVGQKKTKKIRVVWHGKLKRYIEYKGKQGRFS